jgi:hypothetical protein
MKLDDIQDLFAYMKTLPPADVKRQIQIMPAYFAWIGLNKKLTFVNPAHAETPLEPTTGVYKYKVGSIEVTAVYDGIWRKPHDPTFIKNASVEETKAALAKAGLTTEFMPIPLTVIVLKLGNKFVMPRTPRPQLHSDRFVPCRNGETLPSVRPESCAAYRTATCRRCRSRARGRWRHSW